MHAVLPPRQHRRSHGRPPGEHRGRVRRTHLISPARRGRCRVDRESRPHLFDGDDGDGRARRSGQGREEITGTTRVGGAWLVDVDLRLMAAGLPGAQRNSKLTGLAGLSKRCCWYQAQCRR